MAQRYRVTVSDVEIVSPPGDDDPKIKWSATAASVPEGTIVAIYAELDKPAIEPVTAPFRLTGDGVHDTHYRWRKGPDFSDGIKNRPTVDIAPGETVGVVYVEGLVVSTDTTVSFTLTENFTFNNQEFLLSGADLADSDLTNVITIQDSGAGLVVDFQAAGSSATETDSDYTHDVWLSLNKPNDTGGDVTVEVTDNGTGDAVAGTDYSLTSDPLTVTFANGIQVQRISVTIKSTESDSDNETLVLALQNAGAGLTLGTTQQTHTLVITDDETGTPGGTVGLVDETNESRPEGSTVSIPVVYDGGSTHGPLTVAYTVAGTTDGPTGRAAGAADFTIQSPNPIVIQNGETQAVIELVLNDDETPTGDRDIKVNLSQLTAPIGVSFSSLRTKYVTIQEDDAPPPPGDGVDGDLTRIDGTRIAAERRGFDHTSPDFIVRAVGAPGGSGTAETYEIVSDRAEAATGLSKGVRLSSHSAIKDAVELAHQVWLYLHGPSGTLNTYADTDAVPVGTELAEVLVQINPYGWDPTRLSDQKSNGDPRFISFGESLESQFQDGTSSTESKQSAEWSGTTMRDLIIYSEVTNPATCPSMSRLRVGATAKLDNVRFERIHFVCRNSGKSIVSFRGGNEHSTLNPTDHPVHGRVKFYDCQYSAHPDIYSPSSNAGNQNGYSPFSGAKHVFLAYSAAWDIRYRQGGMPWPACWPGYEHNVYVQTPTGSVTYAQLAVDPLDGTYTRASQLFRGFNPAVRHSPWHPGATFNSSLNRWEGPYHSNSRTSFQVTNRPNHSDESDMSSGLMAFVDCDATGFGGAPYMLSWSGGQNPGQAFKIHGHNGEVLFRRCGVSPHPATGKCGGGIKFELEATGDANSSGNDGPTDMWWLERETGRYYGAVKCTVEGFTATGGGLEKTIWTWACPPETIDLKQFNFGVWDFTGGGVQMAFGSPFEHPGSMFLKTFDVSDLRSPTDESVAYTGTFSNYSGWTGGVKITDAYHCNWWTGSKGGTNENTVTLNDDDVDNFPTDGPAGYTQTNGIVDQQYTNRLQAAWGTAGKVTGADGSPTTWTSAYQSSHTIPEKPKCELESSSDLYVGEGTTDIFSADLAGACHTQVRVAFSYVDSGGAIDELQAADQPVWPDFTLSWSTASSPYTLKPLGGKIGTGLKEDTVDTSYWAPEPVVPGYYAGESPPTFDEVFFRFVTNTGLATGTKTVTFNLTSASCEFETYPGSTVWEQCDTAGTQSRSVKVIPAVDYCELSFQSGYEQITDLATGFTTSVGRWAIANADAVELASTCAVTENAATTYTGTYDVTSSLSWSAGDASGTAQTLTISNLSKSEPGAFIVLDLGSYTNAKAGALPQVTFEVTV